MKETCYLLLKWVRCSIILQQRVENNYYTKLFQHVLGVYLRPVYCFVVMNIFKVTGNNCTKVRRNKTVYHFINGLVPPYRNLDTLSKFKKAIRSSISMPIPRHYSYGPRKLNIILTQLRTHARPPARPPSLPHSLTHSPIMVITKLPNSEQSSKGKIKTHKYINTQNQSTTGKLKMIVLV